MHRLGRLRFLAFVIFISTQLICIRPALTQTHDNLCIEPLAIPLNPQNLTPLSEIAAKTQVSENPFLVACGDLGLLDGQMKTGLFRRSIPFQDSKGRSTSDFLNRVARRIEGRMNQEWDKELSILELCFKNPTESLSDECEKLRQVTRRNTTALAKRARILLGTAQYVFQRDFLNSSNLKVNKSLDPLGTTKLKDWSPLTEPESQEALQELQRLEQEVKIDLPSELEERNIKPEPAAALMRARARMLMIKRGLKLDEYRSLITQNRILQFISSQNPNNKEIENAVSNLLEIFKSEREMLDKAKSAINQRTAFIAHRFGVTETRLESMNPAALDVLRYQLDVEEELLSSPEDCAIGASLIATAANRRIGNQLGVAIPVLTVGFFSPLFVGVPLGLATGGWAAFEAKLERDQVLAVSSLGRVPKDTTPAVLQAMTENQIEQLKDAELNYKIAKYLIPLGLLNSRDVFRLSYKKVAEALGASAKALESARNTQSKP